MRIIAVCGLCESEKTPPTYRNGRFANYSELSYPPPCVDSNAIFPRRMSRME